MGPDVILNTDIHKMFGSHNAPHSENSKNKLITIIKQRRVYLANPNPTNTASQTTSPADQAKDSS